MDKISREQYESECQSQGFEILADEKLDWFFERYDLGAAGSAYTNLPDREKAEIDLKMQRGFTVLREAREEEERTRVERGAAQREEARLHNEKFWPITTPKSAPEKGGQLWQECERCGHEPVYMPLMRCDQCWPKV